MAWALVFIGIACVVGGVMVKVEDERGQVQPVNESVAAKVDEQLRKAGCRGSEGADLAKDIELLVACVYNEGFKSGEYVQRSRAGDRTPLTKD